MGQLVFQATAGGQVALVGPNPATNFSLNVPAVNGNLVTTGDTGTVTNTMLASSAYTAPGTIGSGTANTGAFTSLSASTSITNSSLTSGRVIYTGTGGLESASANLTFNGTTLTVANDASISGLTVGQGLTSGQNNTGIGYQVLSSNTGYHNSALGYQALKVNTGGANSAFGSAALILNTTGGSNTAIGYNALTANTTASNNTAVGYQAGYSNTTGTQNVFLGNQAGYTGTTSSYNTAVGYQAGYALTTATGSVMVGVSAGKAVTTGICNTIIGGAYNGGAGVAVTTGQFNTLLGTDAGYLITTGSKNTVLGSYSGNQGSLDIRTASNYIVLSDGDGNPKYYTNGTTHTLATSASTEGTSIVTLGGNWGSMYWTGYGADTANSANAGLKLGKATNGRSINAGGTFNALGTDYAEYMVKAGAFTIAKGDICGIDANGKLTNVFADAISFVVKSSDPSFVGGDKWGVGLEPNSQELEVARQTVDRIAFAGQVPVNVTNATVGQYIIPINNNGEINGQAISNPTFEQYLIAVGKVISVDLTGKPTIIVKVA